MIVRDRTRLIGRLPLISPRRREMTCRYLPDVLQLHVMRRIHSTNPTNMLDHPKPSRMRRGRILPLKALRQAIGRAILQVARVYKGVELLPLRADETQLS